MWTAGALGLKGLGRKTVLLMLINKTPHMEMSNHCGRGCCQSKVYMNPSDHVKQSSGKVQLLICLDANSLEELI